MLKVLNGKLVKAAEGLSYIGAIWIFGIMLFVNADVWGRVFFNFPLKGTPEIVQNSLSGLAFMMMAWATYKGQHVRSTMVRDKLPAKVAIGIDAFAYLIGAILFTGIVIACWKPMLLAWEVKDFQGEGALRVPTYPVWWIIVFGAGLSAWQCYYKIIKMVGFILGKISKKELEEENSDAGVV